MIKKYFVACLASFLFCSSVVASDFDKRAEVKQFIQQFNNTYPHYSLSVDSIIQAGEKQQSILDAISKPAERVLTWGQYRNIFIEAKRIAQGVEFWLENRSTVEAISKKFQVEEEIILAILGVETRYGRLTGNYKVVDALLTLGFDYPPRATFFLSELEHFLLLLEEQGLNPNTVKGSYAGAMGYGQFISSSYRHYAVDGDGDGKIDIINNKADALASVANYFVQHGWRYGEPIAVRLEQQSIDTKLLSAMPKPERPKQTIAQLKAQGVKIPSQYNEQSKVTLMALETEQGVEHWLGFENFYVISRYNHSHLYSMAVLQLSQLLRLHVGMP